MNESYSDLLKRMTDLLEEIRQLKSEIVSNEKKINSQLLENTDLLTKHKSLFKGLKEEIDKHNMSYRLNLEEVSKYVNDVLISDIDAHIKKKYDEMNEMIRPFALKIVKFQESVDDFEAIVSKSMDKLNNTLSKSRELYEKHTLELDRFSSEVAEKKNLDKYIVTNQEVMESIIKKLFVEHFNSNKNE